VGDSPGGKFGGRKMKLLSTKEELKTTLLNIIKQSKNTLKIISPFINFFDKYEWDYMTETLKHKKNLEIYTNPNNKTGKENIIDYIIRKEIVNESNIIPVNNLHAKIYINDDMALLSSMNLVYSSYNKSIDFGIVTENPEELKEVIEYCKKNIFIYNRNTILDYFSKENINAENVEFEKDTGIIAKLNERVNYLKLKKCEDTYIRCSVFENDNYPDKIYFYFDIKKNNEEQINNRKYAVGLQWSKRRKRHYLTLPKNKYDNVLLIPVINAFSEEILGKLVNIYNSI
jgi:hypothetical protein